MSDPIKDALNMIPYGFYAITSKADDEVNIMVANWLSQMSFSPRLVAVGIAKSAYSHDLMQKGRVFAVNIFHKEDADLIKGFTKSIRKNSDKVKDASFTAGAETGCPIVEGAAAYLECEITAIIDLGGDHDIIVGEPIGAGVSKAGDAADTLSLPHIGWSYAG
jgi:flavin reductase (DIM6/NTAB) family NADH-FMN oxidoreductase RutF